MIKIVEEIDDKNRQKLANLVDEDRKNINPYLKNAREIAEWMRENNTDKPPTNWSPKDEKEKRLGIALGSIRVHVINPYKEALKIGGNKFQEYKEKYPYAEEVTKIVEEIDRKNIHPYLKNAREIAEWMRKNNTDKPPAVRSRDEKEKRLGMALGTIRSNVIKPYKEALKIGGNKLQEYKEKYPYAEEVIKIVEEIDDKNSRRNR